MVKSYKNNLPSCNKQPRHELINTKTALIDT